MAPVTLAISIRKSIRAEPERDVECSIQPLINASATCRADDEKSKGAQEKLDKKLIAIASKALQPMPESSSDTRVTTLRHSCASWTSQAEKGDGSFMT
jgi:hypothetical protein